MPLSAGEQLGPYQILAPIGAGGMGEVYRARDSRLNRDVAIKVSAERFNERFEREARVIGSLNHPNICSLFDVGPNFLVMELVEGPTLAERIREGAIPLEESLEIARQIASALEAAHEKGVVHRDLKPGNVKIKPDGAVKVLDFGLAKTGGIPSAPSENSPTLSLAQTEAGVILGTAAYMAPEQARGRPVDKRADIWAFGVVLYEMLTGKRLFAGETMTEVLAAVIERQPPLDQVPAQVRTLLRRCLEKDPNKRLRDIGDAMPLVQTEQEREQAPRAAAASNRLPWVVACAFAIAMAILLWSPWRSSRTPADSPFVQVDLDAGPDEISQPIVSPNGSLIVAVSKGQLVTRRLDQTKITPLSGTEGASFPFFSPDGRWVAFFADGKLKKLALDGGAPQTICDAVAPRGGSWGEDNNIIGSFSILGGLSRVPAAGGAPQPLTDTKGDPERMTAHRWPQILPGGKGVIFAATAGLQGSLRVLTPDGQMKGLVPGSTYGKYLPSGHLIYYQAGALFAAPMDLNSLALTGPAVTLADSVAYTPNVAHAAFDSSPSGSLVYIRGQAVTGYVVSWMDSAGVLSPLLAKPREYSYPRLSPDGKRLAVVVSQGGQSSLWVYDHQRDTFSRLTSESVIYPVWTPDGEFIMFGGRGVGWTRADGSARGETDIIAKTGVVNPWSVSNDAKYLAYGDSASGGSMMVSVERIPEGVRLGKPESLVQNGLNPAISSDGRFVAYSSNQSGRSEIYVTTFLSPAAAAKAPNARTWSISNEGGAYPIWSQAGRELFYLGPDRRIHVASYSISGDSFVPEKARVWSGRQLVAFGNVPTFSMAPDGKRAAVLLEAGGEAPKPETHIRVLLNVGDELRRRTALAPKQ